MLLAKVNMQVTKEFTFDAAHFLPFLPESQASAGRRTYRAGRSISRSGRPYRPAGKRGKCERIHGHTFKLQVTVKGKVGKDGLVFDFCLLKEIVEKRVLEKLDHRNLNDLFKIPSTENIAIWIWKKLKKAPDLQGVKLEEIKLWETPVSSVSYRG